MSAAMIIIYTHHEKILCVRRQHCSLHANIERNILLFHIIIRSTAAAAAVIRWELFRFQKTFTRTLSQTHTHTLDTRIISMRLTRGEHYYSM